MSIPVHATFFSNNLRVRQTINVYMKKGEEKGGIQNVSCKNTKNWI